MAFFDKLDVASVLERMSMTCREAKAKQRELLLFEVISRTVRDTTYLPRRLGVIWSSEQAHTVDALAVRGDEGRGSLRKVSGSWQQALIRQCPNGETHPQGYRTVNS